MKTTISGLIFGGLLACTLTACSTTSLDTDKATGSSSAGATTTSATTTDGTGRPMPAAAPVNCSTDTNIDGKTASATPGAACPTESR